MGYDSEAAELEAFQHNLTKEKEERKKKLEGIAKLFFASFTPYGYKPLPWQFDRIVQALDDLTKL